MKGLRKLEAQFDWHEELLNIAKPGDFSASPRE